MSIIDLRGKWGPPLARAGYRAWARIEGVTLHQTACELADTPRRWDTLRAHIGLTREGIAYIVNDPTDWIWHAQGLSRPTIGVEVEGLFRGTMAPGDAPQLTLAQEACALGPLYDWLVAEFAAHGQPWTRVHAHRQSSATRPGDPGEEIWRRIALPWLAHLGPGASDGGAGWHVGGGQAIPAAWRRPWEVR